MNEALDNLTALADWLNRHGSDLLIPAGALLGLVLAFLIRRAVRTGHAAGLAVGVAVLLATAFSAEGMYEVAREQLGLPWYLAAGLFVVAEAAMLASAVRAGELHKATGSLGMHGRFVWIIAGAAGVIVSLNGRNLVEVLLRLLLPLLVAGLWWMGYQTSATRERAADAITWTLSPRRILVRLGLAEAGERDVIAVSRDRHTDRLTVTAHRVHHGWQVLRPLRSARLRRLALRADDAMVAEVQARITRVHRITTLTAPGAVERPADIAADLPADIAAEPRPTRAPRKAPAKTAIKPVKTTPRRPAGVTKALAEKALASSSSGTRKDVAERLDISPRQLRRVLNGDTGEQALVTVPYVAQDEMPAAVQPVNGQLPGQMTLA